jgi:hypothetical protein
MGHEVVTENRGSGQTQTVIISDSAAKWLVIVFLAFAAAYAVVRAEGAHDAARTAQQEADLAKYYTIDMETYLFKQGLTPPADPWRIRPRNKPQVKT